MNKLNKKGFTLIEMLVVIAIIAVLVAIIVPTVKNSTMKAKGAADAANIRSMTAQAAIDFMEGDANALTEKTWDSKVFGDNKKISFVEDSGTNALKAVIGDCAGATDLDAFVNIAETGDIPGAK